MYKLKDYEREKVNKFIKFCCDARSGELKRRIKTMTPDEIIWMRGKLKYQMTIGEKETINFSVLALLTSIFSVSLGVRNFYSDKIAKENAINMLLDVGFPVIIIVGMLFAFGLVVITFRDKAKATMALSYLDDYGIKE